MSKLSKLKWTFLTCVLIGAVTTLITIGNKQVTLEPEMEDPFSELVAKYTRLVRESSTRNKTCRKVHQNPASFWRSVTVGTRTYLQDIYRMNLASECGAFYHTQLVQYNPRDPPFPWEQKYLSLPPPRDTGDRIRTERCSVELLNSSDTPFTVGDKVAFKIIIRRADNANLTGGDSVHLWLRNVDLKASTAADVTDNNDGSYTATSLLPWVGDVHVKVAIDHPRELFRTVIFLQRMLKSFHYVTGTFATWNASESTPCSPFPAIPAFSTHELCNLTQKNGGYPWYCGKPIKANLLNCSHWISVRKLNLPGYLPLSKLEEEIVKADETKRPFLIATNIKISVQPSSGEPDVVKAPEISCNARNLSLTFNDSNQSGYFYNSTWRPYDCQLPAMDKAFLSKCFKDTQFIMIGDSNTRLQMTILTSIVNCTQRVNRANKKWHTPLRCDNTSIGMSIKYFPPKHPFYGSMWEDLRNNVLFSTVDILDRVPSTGNYLVHLHEFLHLVPFHLSLAEQRLHILRAAIARMLARNEKAHVVFQSAHSAFNRMPHNKHKLSVFLLDLQRRILGGLGERVMFALAWPMTIASENTKGHPDVSDQITALYMGYMCGRW